MDGSLMEMEEVQKNGMHSNMKKTQQVVQKLHQINSINGQQSQVFHLLIMEIQRQQVIVMASLRFIANLHSLLVSLNLNNLDQMQVWFN
jgi:hypothetical protein